MDGLLDLLLGGMLEAFKHEADILSVGRDLGVFTLSVVPGAAQDLFIVSIDNFPFFDGLWLVCPEHDELPL